MILLRDEDVVTTLLELYAQTSKLRGDDTQILVRHVLDRKLGLRHSGHTDEAAHLDHIGQKRMLRAAQLLHTLDGEQVGCYTRNLCAHAVEHLAELLQVGLAGGVVDRRGALGHHGSHHDVGCARNRSLIQKHITSLELLGLDREKLLGLVEVKCCTQLLESEEVGVQTSAADLVATGLGHITHAKACQQRADHHHRTTQTATAAVVVLATQVVEVDVGSREGVAVATQTLHLYAHALQ